MRFLIILNLLINLIKQKDIKMPVTIIILTTILFLAAASYHDLKTGEIPDKVSIGLVAAVLILSLFGAVLDSINFLINAVLIGALYFIIGYASYYLGKLGGGDVKLLAGIGCAIANIPVEGFIPNYLVYMIDAGIAVMPYAAIYGLILGLQNRSVFPGFVKEIKNIKVIFLFILSLFPMLLLFSLPPENIKIILIILAAFLPIFVILTAYLKVTEKVVMQKTIPVSELKEEDILAEDIMVDGRKIAGKNDISGVTKEQAGEIQKFAEEGKIPGKITIKWGIKFAPVLFIGFLIFVIYGNVIEYLMHV